VTAFYSVVQYVPDPVAGERINIGVIAVEGTRGACRFVRDWERAGQFGREDATFLQEFARSVETSTAESAQLLTTEPPLNLSALRRMAGRWRNSIQLTEPAPSVLDYRTLIDKIAPVFLKEEPLALEPSARGYRDKRSVAGEVHRELRAALIRRFGTSKVARMVDRGVKFQGRRDRHAFDVAVKNATIYLGTFTISFELPEFATLDSEADRLYWDISDLRAAHTDLPLAVVTYPPAESGERSADIKALYSDMVRICESFQARVVPTEALPGLADETAARVPPEALPRDVRGEVRRLL